MSNATVNLPYVEKIEDEYDGEVLFFQEQDEITLGIGGKLSVDAEEISRCIFYSRFIDKQ